MLQSKAPEIILSLLHIAITAGISLVAKSRAWAEGGAGGGAGLAGSGSSSGFAATALGAAPGFQSVSTTSRPAARAPSVRAFTIRWACRCDSLRHETVPMKPFLGPRYLLKSICHW